MSKPIPAYLQFRKRILRNGKRFAIETARIGGRYAYRIRTSASRTWSAWLGDYDDRNQAEEAANSVCR